jgi:F0F1-type ATP synthase membrane subunit b/b'
MATANTQHAPSYALKAYEDKVNAQIDSAKAALSQFEAKAKGKQAQAEIDAANALKTAKENIDRKLKDLKTTHASLVARAKADIDADVSTFKASIDGLTAKFKTNSKK